MKIRVACAQLKPKKGDYPANLARVGDCLEQAAAENAVDVLVFPETVLSGYFLEGGVREVARTSEELFADLLAEYRRRGLAGRRPLDVVIGFYETWERKFYNAALYATLGGPDDAALLHTHRKFFLPTYGVFDEKRFVSRGRNIEAFDTRFGRVATLVCEDLWHSITATVCALKGAQVLYVVAASPGRGFSGRQAANAAKWRQLLVSAAEEHGVFIVHAGLVGFEGGKGFVGSSAIVDPFGEVLVEGPVLDEALVTGTVHLDDIAVARAGSPLLADLEAGLADLMLELGEVERRAHTHAERPLPGERSLPQDDNEMTRGMTAPDARAI